MPSHSVSESIVLAGGTATCSLCGVPLAGTTDKAIKQHLKSKTHKANSKRDPNADTEALPCVGARDRKRSARRAAQHRQDDDEENDGEGDDCDEREDACTLCEWLGRNSISASKCSDDAAVPSSSSSSGSVSTDMEAEAEAPTSRRAPGWRAIVPLKRHRRSGSSKDDDDDTNTNQLELASHQRTWSWCVAPRGWFSPTRRELARGHTQPFVTLKTGSIAEVPDDLEHALQLYCNAGAPRMPNIDVANASIKADSWGCVRRILRDAHAARQSYWAAFVVTDAKVDPEWWPSTDAVPTYDQVIVSSGASDIGCHQDNYGAARRPVDTYLTIVRGAKRVIMMPESAASCAFHALMHPEPPHPHPPFPRDIASHVLAQLVAAGGFYFDLAPIDRHNHVTLFIPKGWHHWLECASDWAVVFSSSRF